MKGKKLNKLIKGNFKCSREKDVKCCSEADGSPQLCPSTQQRLSDAPAAASRTYSEGTCGWIDLLLRPEERAFLFSQPYRGAVHESSRVRVLVHRPAPAGSVSGPVSGSVGSEARRSSACTRVGRSSVSTSACAHTRVSWPWARLPRSRRLSPGRPRREGGVVRRSAEAGPRGVDARGGLRLAHGNGAPWQ